MSATLWGLDVSNYTEPLTPVQLDYVARTCQFAIIGLQNADVARAFQEQLRFLRRHYYLDRPDSQEHPRDLSIPERLARVFIDVEPDCFQSAQDIMITGLDIQARHLRPGMYGNENSIVPVISESTMFADLGWPLWWSNYGSPDLSRFVPFNGWRAPAIMQYSSAGILLPAPSGLRQAGRRSLPQALLPVLPLRFAARDFINADLDVMQLPEDAMIRLQQPQVSAWYEDESHQTIAGSAGVNVDVDFPDVPPDAVAVEAEIFAWGGPDVEVCDGDEGDDSRLAFTLAPSEFHGHGRVNLESSPAGGRWFHLVATVAHVRHVKLVGYYLE